MSPGFVKCFSENKEFFFSFFSAAISFRKTKVKGFCERARITISIEKKPVIWKELFEKRVMKMFQNIFDNIWMSATL